MRTSMVHASFDLVDTFIPRVPENRIKGEINEDSTTPRICVAPDIISAMRAMPKAGEVIRFMEEAGIPAIIHVYYLTAAGNIYEPTEDEVPDVGVTGERWLLEEPQKVLRRDYILENPCLYGKSRILAAADIRPARYADNILNLLGRMGRGADVYLENAIRKASFRQAAISVGGYILDIIRAREGGAAQP